MVQGVLPHAAGSPAYNSKYKRVSQYLVYTVSSALLAQVLSTQLHDGPLADVWSLGVCLVVLLTGAFPVRPRLSVRTSEPSCCLQQARRMPGTRVEHSSSVDAQPTPCMHSAEALICRHDDDTMCVVSCRSSCRLRRRSFRTSSACRRCSPASWPATSTRCRARCASLFGGSLPSDTMPQPKHSLLYVHILGQVDLHTLSSSASRSGFCICQPRATCCVLRLGRPLVQVSNSCSRLVQKMLTVDPGQRITAADVLRHPWVQTNMPPELAAINDDLLVCPLNQQHLQCR